jgi:hypothetical protein
MDKKDPMTEFFGPAISTYTRAMAIEDGVLIDITDIAKTAGLKFPVAVTHTVWNLYIEWKQGDSDQQTHQDQSGRLWDIVWMARHGISGAKDQSSQIHFYLDCIPRDGKSKRGIPITLKLHLGPGDQGEPVLTIMLPEED